MPEEAAPELTDDLRELIKSLGQALPKVRQKAAYALGNLGDKAKAALPGLLDAFRDPVPDVCRSAIFAATTIAPEDQRVEAALLELLAGGAQEVSWEAVLGLACIHSQAAIPHLLTAVNGEDEERRERAAYALTGISFHCRDQESNDLLREACRTGLSVLFNHLQNAADRETLLNIQEHIRETVCQHSTPALMDLLREQGLPNQNFIVTLFGCIGPAAHPAVPALLELAPGSDQEGLDTLLSALRRMGQAAVPALMRNLQEVNPERRVFAATVLGELSSKAQEAIPDLLKLSQVPLPELRQHALWALGQIGLDDPKVVMVLIESLEDSKAIVRQAAAEALGRIKTQDDEAQTALRRALRKDRIEVREEAASALIAIGLKKDERPPNLVEDLQTAVEVLLEQVRRQTDEREARAVCNRLVMQFSPRAEAALPALLRGLKEQNEMVHTLAVRALGKIGPAAQAAIPELIKGLKAYHPTAECTTLEKLGKLAIPALMEALKNPEEEIRWNAIRILAHFGPEAHEAVPALRDLMQDSDHAIRYRALLALSRITPTPSEVLRLCASALLDRHAHVRELAEHIVQSISESGKVAERE
jgi:HEAT repeat protein